MQITLRFIIFTTNMEIPEDKLYRVVKLLQGQFEGEYRIYWNRTITEMLENDPIIYKWGDCLDALPGHWIESYDGTVLKILDKRIYKDKKNRTFYFFRFPTATVYAWVNHKGIAKYRQLQGNFMNGNRNTMRQRTFGGQENQKLRFVSLLIGGINPLKAYRLAFNNFTPLPVTTIHRKVNLLMNDEIVRRELNNQIEPIIEKLNEVFPDDLLVKELKLLLDNSKKGTEAHRENIKFIMALLNKLPEAMYPGNKKSKSLAVDTPYLEERPPQHMLPE